jgi:hypothetical protein
MSVKGGRARWHRRDKVVQLDSDQLLLSSSSVSDCFRFGLSRVDVEKREVGGKLDVDVVLERAKSWFGKRKVHSFPPNGPNRH